MSKTINEQDLLKKLTDAGFPKDNLKKYVQTLVDLRKENLAVEKWWIVGQPNPEIFHVVGRLGEAHLGSLAGMLRRDGVSRVKIFPKGIINPEAFDVHLEIDSNQF